MTRLGIGIIGAGRMGRIHALTYAGIRDVEVKVVCDLDERLGKEVAGLVGAEWTPEMDRVLDRDDVAAVSICMPDHLHREACERAARAGKPMLLEKPIATSVEDGEAIIEAATRAGVLLMVGHTLRFDARYFNVKQVIDSGEIGRVQTLFARRMGRRSYHLGLKGRVSLPLFLGVHDFDVLRWFAGSEVVKVTAEGRRGVFEAAGQDVDDAVSALLRFENGVVATVELAWNLPDQILGYQFKADVLCEKGWVELSCQDQGVVVSKNDGIYVPDTTVTPTVYGHVGGTFRSEIEHFLWCIATGSQPVISPQDALAAVRIALAVEEAARSGQPVHIDFEQTSPLKQR